MSVDAELETAFLERGWIVIDLAGADLVATVADALLHRLRSSSVPELTRLEDYHRFVGDDHHDTILFDLARWYWERGLGRRIVEGEAAFLRAFVGVDLHVQRYPYLRVARPARADDVTGMHRDTLYGASPYEVSMVVPFTNLDERGALRVVSGSHVDPPNAYPARREESPTVVAGSPRHLLGFPYAPQVLDPGLLLDAEPVPLRVGQALLFSLGLVHGQVENESTSTRFSTDIRVVNSLAPVKFARGVRADYYEPLCTSAVTSQAHRYFAPRPDPSSA